MHLLPRSRPDGLFDATLLPKPHRATPATAMLAATAEQKLYRLQVRRVCPNAAFVLQLMRWQRIGCRPEAWRWSAPSVSNVKVPVWRCCCLSAQRN